MFSIIQFFAGPLALCTLSFGGGSSSSSATTQTDNRRTIGQGGISNEKGTVNVLDGGAIKNAFDFGGKALDTVEKTTKESLKYATTAQSQVLDSLQTTSKLVSDAYSDAKGRGALTDKILMGAVAMAGVVAVLAINRK